MPVFTPGQITVRGDLDLFLTTSGGNPSNAADIKYAIYWVDPGPPELEVLVGSATRTPVNPTVGEYYASVMIPSNATLGDYRVRWTFRELTSNPYQQVVQVFTVAALGTTTTTSPYSAGELSLINSLRMLLRDQNPSRNYHFRPPEHEGAIGQYNRVFGQIWEDAELYEYLQRGLAWWNMFPPATNVCTLTDLYSNYGAWTTAVLWAALTHAMFAIAANWVADEFSVAGDTLVRVVLPGGRVLDVAMEDLYESCEMTPEILKEIRAAYLAGELQVEAVDPSTGTVGLHQVSKVLRHQTPSKRIFEVALQNGSSVVCTEDHSLFILEEGGITPVLAVDLGVGVPLAVVRDGVLDVSVVVQIEEQDPLPITYDLSVPGPENFVLSNGILAHNSYSIGGVNLDLERSSKYESLKNNAESMFDKATEAKARTVKIIRGLQQPRFGVGVRSAFGPALGQGVLSPRNFL